MSLYTADSLRRLFTETMLPYAMQTASAWQAHRQQKTAQAKGAKDNAQQNEAVEAELRRDEYEQFDDYLEMVIQFGYVTLFASAFPLSAALSIACNVLEIRSDMAKLTFVTRRPRALRASNIGTWNNVVKVRRGLAAMRYPFAFHG